MLFPLFTTNKRCVYICYFSIVAVKHYDQGNLSRKSLFGLWFQSVKVHAVREKDMVQEQESEG